MAIESSTGRDHIQLSATGGRGFETLNLVVGFDGSVVAEGAVGGDQTGLDGMVVLAERAREVIREAHAAMRHLRASRSVRPMCPGRKRQGGSTALTP